MAKPLHLFIQPPYDAAPDGPWTQQYGYGFEQPPADPPVIHSHALLRTTGNGLLYAAAEGRLSMRPPAGGGLDPLEEVAIPSAVDPLPVTVNLYLHAERTALVNPAFRLRARQMNNIEGFAYLNLEAASLEANLAELLDAAVIPASSLTRAQVVERLVRGNLDVRVTAGHAIGRASANGAPAGSRQVGFTAQTRFGPLDPAHTYDWMRDFVEDAQPELDALLAVMPKRWPVIDANLSTNDAINLTTTLYPMPVLLELKNSRNLSPAQWRQVGDNQKTLWRNRLLVRTGHEPASSTDPPFEFDDLDWRNLFQLEAVAEFFANYDDPWAAGATPVQPGSLLQGVSATESGSVVTLDGIPDLTQVRLNHDTIYLELDTARGSRTYRVMDVNNTASQVTLDAAPNLGGAPSAWRLDLYTTVNLLDPAGRAATAAGAVVTLDGADDLTRVRAGKDKDIIFLDSSAGRATRQYRVTAIDVRNRTVTVDIAPNLTATTSAWQIYLRPVLVIIDGFGGRLKGTNARVLSGNPNTLQLDGLPAQSKISGEFDTIYLPNDTNAAARPKRTYRILEVNDGADTVRLDGNPNLSGGSSPWHIPAGVSGEPPTLAYTLGPGTARSLGRPLEWDHYDGALLIVYQGEVRQKIRWSSYASHTLPNGDPVSSSLRGNRRYDYFSLRANSNDFINYAFAVADADATYIGVREARFYYDDPVTEDRAGPTANPETDGKTGVFLHRGNTNMAAGGNASSGCLVSPSFYDLRDDLVQIFQNEQQAVVGAQDREVQKVSRKTHRQSKTLWTNTRRGVGGAANQLTNHNWKYKLFGTLWVIRPDERPL